MNTPVWECFSLLELFFLNIRCYGCYYKYAVQETVQEVCMIATNYTNARANLKSYMDMAKNDYETIVITSKDGNVVMLSEEEYNNLAENYFIMSNPELTKRLDDSINQIINGEVVSISLEELREMEK